jgi:predicted aspartyl protease
MVAEKATALIDSGATENFVDRRTAERWRMLTKELTQPRPIVNVDGTENKAGKVTKACILKVRLNGQEELQRFYITDLGFDRVLLGYPWLSRFNPRIDWKHGTLEGRIRISTTANTWQKWKDLREQEIVAQACFPEEWEIGNEWEAISRTNFAQDWD